MKSNVICHCFYLGTSGRRENSTQLLIFYLSNLYNLTLGITLLLLFFSCESIISECHIDSYLSRGYAWHFLYKSHSTQYRDMHVHWCDFLLWPQTEFIFSHICYCTHTPYFHAWSRLNLLHHIQVILLAQCLSNLPPPLTPTVTASVGCEWRACEACVGTWSWTLWQSFPRRLESWVPPNSQQKYF